MKLETHLTEAWKEMQNISLMHGSLDLGRGGPDFCTSTCFLSICRTFKGGSRFLHEHLFPVNLSYFQGGVQIFVTTEQPQLKFNMNTGIQHLTESTSSLWFVSCQCLRRLHRTTHQHLPGSQHPSRRCHHCPPLPKCLHA